MPGRFYRIFGNKIVRIFEPVETVTVPFVVRGGRRHLRGLFSKPRFHCSKQSVSLLFLFPFPGHEILKDATCQTKHIS